MNDVNEPYLKSLGKELWESTVTPIWKVDSFKPPEIWYFKKTLQFMARYRTFLERNRIDPDNFVIQKPDSSFVFCPIDPDSFVLYHYPVASITLDCIKKYQKVLQDRELSVLDNLAHELNECALLLVNPILANCEMIEYNVNALREGKINITDMSIMNAVRHLFVYEGEIETLNRRGYNGKEILTKMIKSMVDLEKKRPIEHVLGHRICSKPLVANVLTLELLGSLNPQVDSLRSRAANRDIAISEEERSRYGEMIATGMKKIGFNVKFAEKTVPLNY